LTSRKLQKSTHRTLTIQKEWGELRIKLAQLLDEEGRRAEASAEYGLALNAYREAAARAPGDEAALKAIRDLLERGIR
jgi:hypothetical protein